MAIPVISYTLPIDFDKRTRFKRMQFVQGDSDTSVLNFDFEQSTTGLTCYLTMITPDRDDYLLEVTLSSEFAGTITLPNEVLNIPGNVYCQIALYDGTSRVTLPVSFMVSVVTDFSELAIEGSDHFPILTELIEDYEALSVWETYDEATDYVVGNKVAYDGSSYLCIADSTGNLPTDASYWILIAEKGDPGADGADGVDGAAGVDGADGNGIDSIALTSTDGLVDTYTITFTDATTTTFDVTNGAAGADGEDGADGIGGTQWLTGAVDPTTEGSNGDLYLNTASFDVFKKSEGAWGSAITNIGGADGTDGEDGTDGTDGATWLSGTVDPTTEGADGDFYLNTSSYDVFKKAAGSWGSALLNIKGATGAAGSNGTDGEDGEDGVYTPSVGTTASSASLTIDSDTYDHYTVTALAEAMEINAPSGTPISMQQLILRIKDNGTARALTWNAAWRAIGVTLPATTVISKTVYVGAKRNSTDSKWDVLAVAQEA